MSEKFYDEIVAPKLAEIAKLCTDDGMSFVACVEFDGILAETSQMAEGYTFASVLVESAIRARGNVDALAIAAYCWALINGGIENSIVLRRMKEEGG